MAPAEQGFSEDRYSMVPRTLIFLDCGDLVLMLKGSPSKKIWASKYNGIGGHVERGEDIINAAKRELFEESGFRTEDLWLGAVVTIDVQETGGILLFVFRGQIDKDTCKDLEPATSVEGSLEWVHRSEVFDLPLVDDLPVLLPKLFSHREGDPIIYANYKYDDDDLAIVFA
jgi:8-oxo-dGTP diphosphatase